MKRLSKKQLAVIEDLFAGELDEQAILDKYKVSRSLYNRWLADERFAEQFNERIGRAYRQSELIIARYAPLAASKLVQLTACEKEETARKACLDILCFPRSGPQFSAGSSVDSRVQPDLPAETASKLLAVLAEQQPKNPETQP